MLMSLSGHVASEVCLNPHDEIDILQIILCFWSFVNFGDHELLAVLTGTGACSSHFIWNKYFI